VYQVGINKGINLLMLCKAKVTVGCEIIQHTQMQCEHHVEVCNVKLNGT